MVIKYEVTPADVVAFNLFCHRNSYSARQDTKRLRFSLPLLSLPLPIMAGWASGNWWGFPVWGVTSSLLMAFLPSLSRWEMRSSISSLYGMTPDKIQVGKHKLEVRQEALRVVTDFTETSTRWDAIEKVVVTRDHVFIFQGAVTAYIVPKRTFATRFDLCVFLDSLAPFVQSWLELEKRVAPGKRFPATGQALQNRTQRNSMPEERQAVLALHLVERLGYGDALGEVRGTVD